MYEVITKNIQLHISLSEEELAAFCSNLTLKSLKSKEFLYQEGQVCNTVAFVNRGCLRYFYLVEGEEQTGQFFLENAWYTNYESFLTEKPTKQFIQTLEPTELLILHKTALTHGGLGLVIPYWQKSLQCRNRI